MAKQPWLKLWTADTLAALATFTPAARGAWLSIVCVLSDSPTRGIRILPLVKWARSIGATVDQTQSILKELQAEQAFDFADCDDGLQITSRRMVRESQGLKTNAERQARFRAARNGVQRYSNAQSNAEVTPCVLREENEKSNASVTQEKRASNAVEDRRQKTEKEEINKEERRKHRFQRPTLEEVSAYVGAIKASIDPQRWLDYYEANGWRVGRNPMRDWKAAVRTWKNNGYGASKTYGTQTNNRNAGTCNDPAGAGGSRSPIQTAESLSGSLPLDDVPA